MSGADPQRTRVALGLTLALLVLSNVVANRALPSGWYVPWNLAVALALVLVATRVGGLRPPELGMGAGRVGAGLRWGGTVGGVVVGAVAVLAILPGTSEWFTDHAGRISTGELLFRLLVAIPLGTVVMEEVAFRGCLLALLDAGSRCSRQRASLVSSGLFGLWHVLPSWNIGDRNEALGSAFGETLGRWAPIAATVVATAVAGLVFVWLRRRSGSVVAPMLLHQAVNAAGMVAAWLAAR